MEQIDINLLVPNKDNPRYITEEKLDLLEKSLRDFPDMLKIRPLLIDNNNLILGGNMRYKAAKRIGLKKVWCVRVENPNIKEITIKDNISQGLWDYEKLTTLFDGTELLDWGVEIPEWYLHNQDLNFTELDPHQRHNNNIEVLTFTFKEYDYYMVVNYLQKNKLKLDKYLKDTFL